MEEFNMIKHLITKVYPKGIVSIVSDTWNFWRVVTEYSEALRDIIINRAKENPGSKVVFRPDSGDPVKIVCGDPEVRDDHPAHRGAAVCLWQTFGGERTAKSYIQINPAVGLIYGDSINLERAPRILAGLAAKQFSSGCVVLGIGSYSYQRVTRDTFATAIKATFGVVDAVDRELEKDPITDDGLKKSARGLLRVEESLGHYILHEQQTREQEACGALQPVFLNGKMRRLESLAEIRTRLHPYWENVT